MRCRSFPVAVLVFSCLAVTPQALAQTSADATPMVRFTDAEIEFDDFGARLGVYEACYDLAAWLRDNGASRAPGDEVGALPLLYQVADEPQQAYRAFLQRMETGLGFDFDKMEKLDRVAGDRRSKERDVTMSEFRRLMGSMDGQKRVLLDCTRARNSVEGGR